MQHALPVLNHTSKKRETESFVLPLQAEIAGLPFMCEEEKLAHEAYLTPYQQWGLPILGNTAHSEAAQLAARLLLKVRFGGPGK
jgi:hypothetical protein